MFNLCQVERDEILDADFIPAQRCARVIKVTRVTLDGMRSGPHKGKYDGPAIARILAAHSDTHLGHLIDVDAQRPRQES